MSRRVWSTFQVTRSDGSLVNFRIQDLPQHRIEDAVELFIKYFIHDEAFPKAAGIAQNPQAIAEGRLWLRESMSDPANHNVVCFVEADDGEFGQIVGVSSTSLVTVGTKPFEGVKPETEEMKTYCNLMEILSYFHKRMEELHISEFYDDRDIIVHPEFRKLGIGTEFLRTRRMACMAHNVAATGALMTSIAMQKVAEQENWETVLEVNLEEFGRKHGVTFEVSGARKFMIWKNPQVQENVD